MNEAVSMRKSHSRSPSISQTIAHSIIQQNNYLPPINHVRTSLSSPTKAPNNQPMHHVSDSLDMLRKSAIQPNNHSNKQSNSQSNTQSTIPTSDDKDSDDEYALHIQFRLKQRANEQIRSDLIRKRRFQSMNQSNADADSDDEVSLSEFIVPPSPKIRTRTLRKVAAAPIEPANEEPFTFRREYERSIQQSSIPAVNQSARNDLSILSAQRQHLGSGSSSVLESRVDDASPIIHVAKRLSLSSSQSAGDRCKSPDMSSPFSTLSLMESPVLSSPNMESPNIASVTRTDSPSYNQSPYLSNYSSPSALAASPSPSPHTPSPAHTFRHPSNLSRKSPESDGLTTLNYPTLEKRSYLTNQWPSSRSSSCYVHQN